jgi:POT family proton-dependent oligopeptide transporter
MNIYASEKTNRILPFSLPFIGNEIPASWFQSLVALFIIILGTSVAGYWAKRKLQGKLSTSLFKMLIGLVFMGTGYFFMSAAAGQNLTTGSSAMYWLVLTYLFHTIGGSSAMYWLVLTYLFHTIGELCVSPVALSYITKLAPVKYASLMMGIYFAMTGIGNKVAGLIGESASKLGEFTVISWKY